MGMPRKIVNIGDRFGKLVIKKEIDPKVKYRRRFICECDCGVVKEIDLCVLGKTTNSCGCNLTENNKIHGMSRTRFYRIYKGIESRTTRKGYKNYSDRGIKNLWKNFNEFYNDMYYTYKEGLSIDRIDVNGHYCKDNCRWATVKQQANNTRTNLYLEYKGRTQTLTQWCEELDLKYQRIRDRIQKYKWSVEKAFETP